MWLKKPIWNVSGDCTVKVQATEKEEVDFNISLPL